MKSKIAAASKKVTAENLLGLGPERLAEILVDVAETRPDLKRRLRMEIASGQGAGPLAAEIDKRLAAFETSRGQVTWRQAPAFLRDVDALRLLIADRLAGHDLGPATERLWRFMATARRVGSRYRQRAGELDAVFGRAAADLGRLLADQPPGPAASDLVEAMTTNAAGWKHWAPGLLEHVSPALAADALSMMSARTQPAPGWTTLIRQLSDAAGDADAYRSTWTAEALKVPHVAAEMANRYLSAGRTEEAGDILRAAALVERKGSGPAPDQAWETAWIAYLEQAGRAEEAQAVRWASFARTLSAARARDFISRLADFDDVEAENRAFAIAARFPDFQSGLRFLMEWPALAEASRMIEARSDDINIDLEAAELWAAKLRRRFPPAAHTLLRKAAAAAFRRRDYKTCDRLTQEADTIGL